MKTRSWLVLVLCVVSLPVLSRADEDDDEGEEHEASHSSARTRQVLRSGPEWQLYAAECGSCHLAFPPSMLPAQSWRRLMSTLSEHFGERADLDAATATRLTSFLVGNAGREVAGLAPLRLTETAWWQREHREIAPLTYRRPSIMTPANCGACHPGANQGAFGEHQVKIPR